MFGCTRSPIDMGLGGSTPWTPLALSNLRQYLSDSYASSPMSSLQVIDSLEEHGDVRPPEPGCCLNYDGINDYSTTGARITSGAVTQLTVGVWLRPTANAIVIFAQEWNPTGNNRGWALMNPGANNVQFIVSGNGSSSITVATASSTLPLNQWTHVCVTFNAGVVKIYLNGVEVSTTASGAVPSSIFNSDAHFRVGASGSNDTPSNFFQGKLRDPRLYSVAVTAERIASLAACDGTNIDKTDALGIWPCVERAGTKSYDISGNGNDLTHVNTAELTFRATDSGITSNVNNVLGYRLSGSVKIPAINDTTAADGNPLTKVGKCPYPATISHPCLTGDGSLYISAPHLSGNETVVSKLGTATPSISAGRIDIASGATLANLLLSDGTYYTFQEGTGSSNTNRTIYDCSSGANHAAIANGTVATFAGSRIQGRDHCFEFGGRIGANGCFIPKRLSGSLCADGNVATFNGGSIKNPFSRVNFNPFSAAEANGKNWETAYAPGDTRQDVTPNNTKFINVSTGKNAFTVDAELTGDDLANAEAFTS